MLVKGHSESGIRVDPASPEHLIGSAKPVPADGPPPSPADRVAGL